MKKKERAHLLHALECIRNSGDKEFDAMTARLEKKIAHPYEPKEKEG